METSTAWSELRQFKHAALGMSTKSFRNWYYRNEGKRICKRRGQEPVERSGVMRLTLPYSDDIFAEAYHSETMETLCDRHVSVSRIPYSGLRAPST